MTKLISNSTHSKIFGTNKLNVVEVNTDKIVESDSESREVVKKGYLLNNINLSTIPDIIQDAIDAAILDAKEQTLADSLISTLRQSIENFDNGVYKKTYIDQTITYLEELLTQKVSPEIVASIAEAKIAIATAEFATASQVNSLASRVGTSESEITNIKETITTKDTARATQIEELQASLNQTLSNYSEAINLTVDADGNVVAQKFEELKAEFQSELGFVEISISETNELIVATAQDWSAKSIKLITSPSGAITGYSFQDGSGLKSNFDIYSENFKISNSYNTYTPFSIIGTSLFFNGKTSFQNTTGTESVVTLPSIQSAIDNNVATINGGKIVATDLFINNINAKGGIIAADVSANEFHGKNFYGGRFEGGLFLGAVIKASYLDLDGELEVLTNYHISTSMYESNPSLYLDAVYISALNEYRIPSISYISEPSGITYINNFGEIAESTIKSWDTANAGHNLKAVKRQPVILYNRSIVAQINCPIPQWTIAHQSVYANSQVVELYLFNVSIGTFQVRSSSEFYSTGEGFAELWKTELYYNGAYQGKWVWDGEQGTAHSFSQSGNVTKSGTTSGISWMITLSSSGLLSVEIWAENVTLPVYFDSSTGSALKVVSRSNPSYTLSSLGSDYYRPTAFMTISQSKLSINNMI